MNWLRSLPSATQGRWRSVVRLLGLALLVWLLLRIDIKGAWQVLSQVKAGLALLAAVLLLPLIGLKSARWLIIMGQPMGWRDYYEATLSYFSGLFLGFLTPGRLGEFVRVIYARKQLEGDTVRATLSVLADRIFDLAALLIFGGVALLRLSAAAGSYFVMGWSFILGGAAIPLVLLALSRGNWLLDLLGNREFQIWKLSLNEWLGSLGKFNFSAFLLAIPLTASAYALFFWQGQLLMSALNIQENYLTAAFTLSLAGLVALLPVSISGLGTREWVITLYLGSRGISAEAAVAFSALVFLAFNVWGSLLGGISWLLYPESFKLDSSPKMKMDQPAEAPASDWAVDSSREGG